MVNMKMNLETKQGDKFAIEMDVMEMAKSGEQLMEMFNFIINNRFEIMTFIDKFRSYQKEDRELFMQQDKEDFKFDGGNE